VHTVPSGPQKPDKIALNKISKIVWTVC